MTEGLFEKHLKYSGIDRVTTLQSASLTAPLTQGSRKRNEPPCSNEHGGSLFIFFEHGDQGRYFSKVKP